MLFWRSRSRNPRNLLTNLNISFPPDNDTPVYENITACGRRHARRNGSEVTLSFRRGRGPLPGSNHGSPEGCVDMLARQMGLMVVAGKRVRLGEPRRPF